MLKLPSKAIPGIKPSALEKVISMGLERLIEPVVNSDLDMTKIENNPEMQRAELEKCKNDVVYWCSSYVMSYDPRIEDPSKREFLFKPFPRQVELINWALERRAKREVGLIIKSRDSGVSIIFGCVLGLHSWLFENGYAGGFGAHVEEKIDRLGDMSSLFEKIRATIRRLPEWMKPKGFDEQKHLLHRRIINPSNGSILTAEIGDQCGRGGRSATYCLDEAAFLAHPDLVEASLSANTPVRYYVSTPNGLGNWFAQKRNSLPPDQVFEYKWDQDPRKDAEWKAKVLLQDGNLVFEREYNCNFAASIEGIAIPHEWVVAAVNLPLPAEGDVVCGFDVAGEGDNLNSLCPRQGPVIMPLRTWKGISPVESAAIAARHAEELKATKVAFDCIGPGEAVRAAWSVMAGDHDQAGGSLPFEAIPIIGGEKPSDHVWSDGKTSVQKFVNVRAECWWLARDRFRKTWEYRKWLANPAEGSPHPLDQLISIPQDDQLISELSTPLIQPTGSGKIQIESKPQMKKRGVRSPDKADSLCYSLYPKVALRKIWWR